MDFIFLPLFCSLVKNKFYILIILVFLGLAGQSIISWITYPEYQMALVEEEAQKNEKKSETLKDKIFEKTPAEQWVPFISGYSVLLKIDINSSIHCNLPERPPRQA